MSRILNPLDSAFVLLEVPGSAMNIGAVIELDVDSVMDPTERFDLIRKNIVERLHEIPVLTQRIVRSPLDLTWPALVADATFDVDRHVLRVALPSPGSSNQFDALVSEFLSRTLVPTRPRWQLLYIEGLEDGRVALALKVHHSLADGVSGAETFAGLFDISPEVRAPAPIETGGERTAAATTSVGLLVDALRRLRDRPQLALEVVMSWVARLFEVVRTVVMVGVARGRRSTTPDQPSVFEARHSSLNAMVSVEKTYHRMSVPLADAKRAAKGHGASVTDFVMATTSGALRRLLQDRGEVLRRDLIAFVPINVRGESETADMGNQISGMLVALHADIADPVQRLRAIAKDSARTVGVQRQSRAKMFKEMPQMLGPLALSLGGKIMYSLKLFDRLPPVANLMVSSVPGPPVPLWLSGHRVASAAPVGPLLGAISLNITVLGFEQNLEFGLLASAAVMPDLVSLRDYLVEEANLLITSGDH
ncbi:MAG: wax ester/triacylglycerol synthase family O-acyltransferase [Acidimicrobiales bacterium]